MKNKPLIDNYEQILDNVGYNYCVIGDIFYVYRMLPESTSQFSIEDWKYYKVSSPWGANNKQPLCWGYQ